MIQATQNIVNAIINPVREIKASVELYEGSTLVETCHCNDRLIKFTIERIGDESKFFGFGIIQKLNVHLIDKERTLNVSTANTIKVAFAFPGLDSTYPYPTFYVSEVRRNENTNELSITAYDLMYPDKDHSLTDMAITAPYTLADFAEAARKAYNAKGLKFINVRADEFSLSMPEGGNFDGSELIRECLNDVAEATQTIFYIDNTDSLVFKRLDKSGNAVWTINKNNYFTLQSRTNRRLGVLYHVTELGDNLHVSTEAAGTTQYVRDNAFWSKLLSTEVALQLESALTNIGGITINQFDCSWRGNFLLEIGDKIDLVVKDNKVVCSYILNDVITYAGTLTENTKWNYAEYGETASNPATISDKLNMTYAKVDKVNQEIELVAKNVEGVIQEQAGIRLDTQSITSSIELLGRANESNSNRIENLTSRLTQTAEDLRVEIQQELVDGTPNKVTTTTGFTFNDEGLTISKTNSEMSTQITEDGLTIYRNSEEMLIADNEGVYAANLNATTFLIIGDNSRFEDYKNRSRTGCFWIGGV